MNDWWLFDFSEICFPKPLNGPGLGGPCLRFPVHRLILASGSDELGALVNGQFAEGDQVRKGEPVKVEVLSNVLLAVLDAWCVRMSMWRPGGLGTPWDPKTGWLSIVFRWYSHWESMNSPWIWYTNGLLMVYQWTINGLSRYILNYINSPLIFPIDIPWIFHVAPGVFNVVGWNYRVQKTQSDDDW